MVPLFRRKNGKIGIIILTVTYGNWARGSVLERVVPLQALSLLLSCVVHNQLEFNLYLNISNSKIHH